MPTPVWTAPRDWVPLTALPAANLDEQSDNFRFLHDQGADLTIASGVLTPLTQWHKVIGGGIADNVTMLLAGARVVFKFEAATTLRHNAGGTGNLRLQNSADHAYLANETAVLISDGTLWWEIAPGVPTFVGAIAYHSTNQTFAATGSPLAFDNEERDFSVPFHDVSSNNSRLTVPAGFDGVYRVVGNLAVVETTSSYDLRAEIRKNGTTVIARVTMEIGSSGSYAPAIEVNWMGGLVVADYVELVPSQNSGGTRNALGGAVGSRFTIQRVPA